MLVENRKYPRKKYTEGTIFEVITADDSLVFYGIVVNISKEGFCLVLDAPYVLKGDIKMAIGEIKVTGELIYSGYKLGAKLKEIDNVDKWDNIIRNL